MWPLNFRESRPFLPLCLSLERSELECYDDWNVQTAGPFHALTASPPLPAKRQNGLDNAPPPVLPPRPQVLEDINPTDDELRESQQRVRLPKREARIGAGGGRAGGSGGSTAGVIGGWLGAAATVGLSTASAGLSTVTGVAGATASAGFSTVTGVAGAMAGRVSAGAGAAGGKGTAGGGGGPVAETAPAAGVPGAATEPDFRGREVDASGPITNDHHGAAGSDGGTGQATVVTQGSGRDADEEMGFDGAGLVTRQPPVGVVSAGVDIVSGQLQDVDVQVCVSLVW